MPSLAASFVRMLAGRGARDLARPDAGLRAAVDLVPVGRNHRLSGDRRAPAAAARVPPAARAGRDAGGRVGDGTDLAVSSSAFSFQAFSSSSQPKLRAVQTGR